MAVTTTAITSIGGGFFPKYWDRVLADNLRPNLYMYDLGEMRTLPRNFGNTIRIPRIKKASATNPVVWKEPTEGVITNTCSISSEFVSGTLQKFKGAYKHSDLVVMTALSDVIQLSIENISYDLARVMDRHIQAQLSKTGLILGTNGKGSGTYATMSTNLSLATDGYRPTDLVRFEVALDARDNPRYPGTNKFALVIHPYNKYDIMTKTSSTFAGWIDINKYNNAEKIFNGEIGSLFGFKVIQSSNLPISTGLSKAAVSFARNFAFAPRAFYVTEIADMSARTMVKQLGSGGTSDPTNDICTVGAKVYFTAIRGGSSFAATEHRMISVYAPIVSTIKI